MRQLASGGEICVARVSETDAPPFENLARAMLIKLIIPWKVILVMIVLGFLARYLSKCF